MASLNSHAKDLSRFWQGKILWDIPMSQFSTLKVGGPAEAIISVTSPEDLKQLLSWLKENDIRWWIIGRGSNILVPDAGLSGVIIILDGDFNSIEKLGTATENPAKQQTLIRAGGGCLLAKLVNYCTSNVLSGLEFVIGIPGSVGGAVVMNAGAWGYEIGSLVYAATLMNDKAELYTKNGADLDFAYRKWGMEQNTLLLFATFALNPGRKEDIKGACQKYQKLRKAKQPLAEPSAGSFFKNPPQESAGRLIEEAGLKGRTIGGAKISEKHANFIVNTGTASATDILKLMKAVQTEVYKRSGITLEPEVHILG